MQDFNVAVPLRRRRSPKAGFGYFARHALPPGSAENDGGGARSVWRPVRELALILVAALLLSSFLRAFLVQAFWIPSSSMEDTLQIGDNVLVSRLTPSVMDIERGDVVVFRDDLGWLPPVQEKTGFSANLEKVMVFTGLRPASGEQHLVKRVIGVGGDRVMCCDDGGNLLINGQPVKEPYIAQGSVNSAQPFDVNVPQGHLWVMGDNRNNSADSRAHLAIADKAFVDVEDVIGRVIWVTWPFNHWSNPTNNAPFKSVK